MFLTKSTATIERSRGSNKSKKHGMKVAQFWISLAALNLTLPADIATTSVRYWVESLALVRTRTGLGVEEEEESPNYSDFESQQ